MSGRFRAAPLLALAVALLAGCQREPVTTGGPVALRRLTEAEYRHSVADVFGADIRIVATLEPLRRVSGLLSIGAAQSALSRAGFEQLYEAGRQIAAQAIDPARRDGFVGCGQAPGSAADAACARSFIGRLGHKLFRRPLNDRELSYWTSVAEQAAATTGDFYAGLADTVAALLVAPEFLYRVEQAEADDRGVWRLTAFSKATRLSYFLWNTTPDDELLAAAARGDLNTQKGLARQVDRMLASPRLETGVRALFADMLVHEEFDVVAKDKELFPAFSTTVLEAAREQELRLIVDHLLARHGDYRDLFTTRHTFMNRTLGPVYRVKVTAPSDWEPFEFAPGDPRAGLLGQAGFLARYSHPGETSSTLRGKAVRELLLCQPVPPPPGNVSFNIVQDTHNALYRTARQRLSAHNTDPTCAGCHKIMDPIGVGLERFNSLGQFRATENGADIDPSGELDGIAFRDAAGLGTALRDNPQTPVCLVGTAFRYGVGRTIEAGEAEWMQFQTAAFAKDGYRLPELLRRIAVSDAFYAVSRPAAPTAAQATR